MKNLLFVFIFLISIQTVFSQTVSVVGTVIDEQGEPLPGVAITISGTSKGVVTNFDGKYSIEASSENTLIFRFIGMMEQSILVGNQIEINVTLVADVAKIDDVVIVGYGTQKKASVLSAITQKKGEELVRTGGVTNVGASLTGKIPGLSTISTSGQPGENNVDIYIRGVATWGSNEPLVLVDGIERDYDDVDLNDIFAISVLKDASATAVYGVRGGNGVILITTKRGHVGKPQLTYSSELIIKQPSMLPNFISSGDQVMLIQEGMENDNPESSWGDLTTRNGFRYPSDETLQHYYDQDEPYIYPNDDVLGSLTRNYGYGHKHNLNISGGTKYVKYFTSLSYMYDGDVLKTEPQPTYDPTFYHRRYNLRSNLDINVTKTTKIRADLSGVLNTINSPFEISAWQAKHENIVKWIMGGSNYLFPFEYEDGTLGHNGSNFAMNPYAALNYAGQRIKKDNKVSMDFSLDQDLGQFVKGLSFNAIVSVNMRFLSVKNIEAQEPQTMFIDPVTRDTSYLPTEDYWDKPVDVGVEQINSSNPDKKRSEQPYERSLYYRMGLDYNRTFGKHNVTGKLLWARTQLNAGVIYRSRFEEIIGRVTYNYDEKYLLELSGSYNGSDKFAQGKRYGFFPAVAVGWRIDQESFIKDNLTFISMLKPRYNYGKVGNDKDVPRWAYLDYYVSVPGWQNPSFGSGTPSPVANTLYQEKSPIANPNMTWETGDKHNAGIEFGFFDNMIQFNADYFTEDRQGILIQRQSLPPSFGAGAPYANLGETKSRGYEFELIFNKLTHYGLQYWVETNYSFSESRILEKDEPDLMPEFQKEEGKPIDQPVSVLYSGYYNSWDDIYTLPMSTWTPDYRRPGDLTYIDMDGNGVIDVNDQAPDKKSFVPEKMYNFTLGASFKGFTAQAHISGRAGVSRVMSHTSLWSGSREYSLERWTEDNSEDALRPAFHFEGGDHNSLEAVYTSFEIRNNNQVRLQTAELSYGFDPKGTGLIGRLQKVEIILTGNNLLYWSQVDKRLAEDYEGEKYLKGAYPLVKRYNIKLKLNF